jgi:hypothetical protein
MATGKVVQPKALLKLPKELPSNIVYKIPKNPLTLSVNNKAREQRQKRLSSTLEHKLN